METSAKFLSKKITDALTHKAKKQPGAILLNGGWGVGKTHFWREEVAPRLKGKNVVYVSLFGLKSADDLRNSLAATFVSVFAAGKAKPGLLNEIVKAVPGLVKKGVEGYATTKLGEKAGEILKALHIKVDPLQIFQRETIVCLDDLERSTIEPEEVLGVISTLLEQKEARVLIIANEDYLSGEKAPNKERQETYKKFKEKVVWQTVGFHIPFVDVFDSFVNQFAASNKREIKASKDLILGTLDAGNCKNLRTLQKIIRLLDEVLEIKTVKLESQFVRFLVALTIEDAELHLLSNAQIYRAQRFLVASFRTNSGMKKYEPEGDDKVGYEFYRKYFEGQTSAFSEALHSFVRNGILDREKLVEELGPEDGRLDLGIRLSRRVAHSIIEFWTDPDAGSFADEIEKYLRDDGKTSAFILIRLYGTVLKLRNQIGSTIASDLKRVVEEKIRARLKAEKGKSSLDKFEFREEQEKRDLSGLVEFCEAERLQVQAAAIKADVLEHLKSGRIPGMNTPEIQFLPGVIQVLMDPEVLEAADATAETSPEAHYRFYEWTIKQLNGKENAEASLRVLNSRIDALYRTTRDNCTKMRLGWLSKGIKAQLSILDSPAIGIESAPFGEIQE